MTREQLEYLFENNDDEFLKFELTEATALSKAQGLWGKYAYVHLRTGAYARQANRPNGEYCIGYKDFQGYARYWYGDSWEDAFHTFEESGYGDQKMLGFTPTLGRDYPGPNS